MKFRHIIYDIVQRILVSELYAENESNEDVYYLIKKYIESKDRSAIVTDTKPCHDMVMNKLCLIDINTTYFTLN